MPLTFAAQSCCTSSPKLPESKDKTEFLATARQRFEDCAADEKSIREQALLDLKFVVGDQWDAAVKNERVTKGRPALTFNRCHTFVQQVSNEARQNKPQIKFVVGDGGDKDTADVKEGIARHIQYSSDAQIAYETAVEYSAGGSFGYFRFLTDYCDDDSFDQDLKIMPVLDPFAVYGILIPSCFGMEPEYGFVMSDSPSDEYKRTHDTDDIDAMGWDMAAKLSQGWVGTETVREAEYWYTEHTKDNLILIKNSAGKTKAFRESKLKKLPKDFRTGTSILDEREIDAKNIKFCKINGLQVSPGSETDWAGYCIPIVSVMGKQIIVDGKPNLFSVVRFQRDPQQLINFYKTRIAETMGTSPIQPYIVEEGQIQGHEKEWNEMHTTMRPYLVVKSLNVNGEKVEKPQRQVFEPPIQSLSTAAAQEIDDMKATAGIYDASLGNKSNETSGIALQKRQQQSNVTNMHFLDNLERAFKKGGLIIADLMPKIYDTERMIRILGEDEAPKIVKINAQHQDPNGKPYHYKVGSDSAGKYDVIVTMGRAFSTKREESFDMMSTVLQAQPELINVVGDVFFQNSDMAGSDIMAERFKRYIQIKFPGLIEDKGSDPQAKAQQLSAQLQQAHEVMQAAQQHIQQLEKEREAKVVETQGKLQIAKLQEQTAQSKAELDAYVKITVAEISSKAQNQQVRATLESKELQALHTSAHEVALQAQQHAHTMQQGQQAAQNQAALADQGHQQTLEQGDQAAANQSALAAQQAEQVSASPQEG